MRLFDFASVKLSIFLIAGILMGKFWEPNVFPVFLLLIFFAFGLTWTWARQKRKGFPLFEIFASLTTITLGVFILVSTLPKNMPSHFTQDQTSMEPLLHLKIRERLKSNDFSERYIAKVGAVNKKISSGKVLLTLSKDSSQNTLKVDDEILVHANFENIRTPHNPYQFNYRNYMKNLGVYGQVRIPKNGFLPVQDAPKTLRGIALNFREHLIGKLRQYDFDKEQLGVIQAILLGERREIDKNVYDDYKDAGAVHILAVSGLHIGILLVLLQFLLRPLERLPKGRTLKLVLIVLILWSYAFVAGLSPSIIRAVTMFTFLAYALYLNRPTNTFNIVALSMFFILLAWPHFLFQVGFQLSYAAVFSIVWIYPKLQRFWYPHNWLLQKGWQLLSVSIAAQLGVLPISLFYFHQFPALFFVSNLLVVPFLGIILGIGILVLLMASFGILPHTLAQGYNHLIGFMNAIISWVAKQEAFLVKDIPFDGVLLLLTYLFIFGLVFVSEKRTFKNIALLFIAVFGSISYLTFKTYETKRTERLLLAHQNKNSIVLYQQGEKLMVFTKDSLSVKRMVTDYKIAQRITQVESMPIQNSYQLNSKALAIIDSTGISLIGQKPKYLLLIQSPKINLNRILDSVSPQIVIADGSNFKSYASRWEKTCSKRKIPFHYTGEKGAYYFELDD